MKITTYRPSVGQAELESVQRVFASGWLGMGEVTQRFEQRLAAMLGARHVVAVSRGTAALHLALDALGIGPGDEVLVPSITFVGSIQAIVAVGAIPVFCEVEPDTLNLDVDNALRRISAATSAIMPVHFAGLPCDMDRIMSAASEHGLHIVEDAAHAFGSSYRGRPIGTIGDLTCFSFDAIKNITCGDGGAVATDDDELAVRIARRRCLGIHREATANCDEQDGWQYQVISHGFRYHMADLNAAIGLTQLDRFEANQQRRRELARRYDDALTDLAGVVPLRRDIEHTCPWAYVVKVSDGRRDALKLHLERRGILTLVQFIPNHLQPAFAPWRTSLPTSEQLFTEILSLPFYPDLTDEQQDQVIDGVWAFAPQRTLASV